MTVFAIMNVANPAAMSNALQAHFPDDHIKISANEFLVAARGQTARNISDKLGVTEASTIGSAIIFTTSGYYGRAPNNVWEWVSAKLAQP
jgi:hypothetical protein